jgi:hypothetical protein
VLLVSSKVVDISRQHRDPVRPAEAGHPQGEGIHTSRTPVNQCHLKIWSALSDHQPRHSGARADVDHPARDPHECGQELASVINHLVDRAVAQRSHSLGRGQHVGNCLPGLGHLGTIAVNEEGPPVGGPSRQFVVPLIPADTN